MHFRRQHPIGPYIADFCCVPIRLVIELDGHFHADAPRVPRDELRTQWLREHGYRVLRFPNDEVWKDIEGVLAAILKTARGTSPSLTLPPPVGGKREDYRSRGDLNGVWELAKGSIHDPLR